jgi:hypothetical protein
MGNPFVIASSAAFFIPSAISLKTQNLLVSIILIGTSVSSTLYHINDEEDFSDLDQIFAVLTLVISVVLLSIILIRHGYKSWRFYIPAVFAFVAIAIYSSKGMLKEGQESDDASHYDLWHSLWHLFIFLSGLSLVITPVELEDVKYLSIHRYKDLRAISETEK